MQINYSHVFIYLSMVFMPGLHVQAQSVSLPDRIETIRLFTDRNLYIAGEEIFFSSLLADSGSMVSGSKVLYLEIVSPQGNRIMAAKFSIHDHLSYGSLKIPEECNTGIYYLRGYTKFMRNSPADEFGYVLLKIVNSFKPGLLSYRADTSKFPGKPTQNSNFKFIIAKNSYHTREKVTLKVKDLSFARHRWQNLCITIVPKYALTCMNVYVKREIVHHEKPIIYPETRGISLTGKILVPKKVPEQLQVYLSILGEKEFMATYPDSSGRFFFSMPDYYGNHDIFLSTAKFVHSEDSLWFVDNDFYTGNVLPDPVPFILSPEENKTACNMAINRQIMSYYLPTDTIKTALVQSAITPFYGIPTAVLKIDDYVPLPTIEDYFNELPFSVKIRKKHGLKYFKVQGPQPELEIFDPLVLIDWVAIHDVDKILSVNPQRFSRIEIVNKPYAKGSFVYGGIISFISKNNDFGGIDLPGSGLFFNYQFFSSSDHHLLDSPQENFHVPDARNTLFWQPYASFDENHSLGISFTTGDTPGIFVALIRSIDAQDREYSQTVEFSVSGR